MHKLDGSYMAVGGVGTEMPPSAPLSAPDQQLIAQWITEGALE